MEKTTKLNRPHIPTAIPCNPTMTQQDNTDCLSAWAARDIMAANCSSGILCTCCKCKAEGYGKLC